MNNIRSFLKKYAAIAAFAISAIVYLPETLFAKGAVVGYVYGLGTNYEAQLDHLTHVMVVDLYIDSVGNVFPNPELTDVAQTYWQGSWENKWLEPFVYAAHQKGVKVSIVIAEGKNHITGEMYYNFSSVTADVDLRNNLVTSIANFVNLHELDGVDIDWEYPSGTDEWENCVVFLNNLKSHPLLQCKRISIALDGGLFPASYISPTPPALPIPHQIWNAVDAIHLMTYDQADGLWITHSNAAASIAAIDAWAIWGASNGLDAPASKEKLFLACAFYGYNISPNGDWGGHIQYKSLGACNNPGDNATVSIPTKVNHCYNQGYGGVFFWELSYDVAIDDTYLPSLLKAIWTANTTSPNVGYPIAITIDTQPASYSTVIQGSISRSLSVEASTAKCIDYPFYQWYSNTTNSNIGGTPISGATDSIFTIPATTLGDYYYFCELKSGKTTLRSGVATVTIAPPPQIDGPEHINPIGSYCLNNYQKAEWSVSSGFIVTPSTGISVNVRAADNTVLNNWQTGTVTATVEGVPVSKSIQACPVYIVGSGIVNTSVNYTLSNGQNAYWSLDDPFNDLVINVVPTTSSASANVTVNQQNYYRGVATLFADLGNGVVISKEIAMYGAYMNFSLTLLSDEYLPDYFSNFSASCTFDGSSIVSSFSVDPGSFDNPGYKYKYISNIEPGSYICGMGFCMYNYKSYQSPKWYEATVYANDQKQGIYEYIQTVSGVMYDELFGYFPEGWYQPLHAINGWDMYVTISLSEYNRSNHSIPPEDFVSANTLQYDKPDRFELTVYPNPTANFIDIEISENDTERTNNDPVYDIRIYDGQGNLLRQQKGKNNRAKFNLSNLPYGVYYLHVYDDMSVKPVVRQIIVEH